MAITKLELEELLEELEMHKGRHTELITVYVAAGYDANAVQRQLEAEKSTAKNIKSTGTRKNVTDALDKIVREIKDIRTPANGLAIFCGNISQVEGQDDLRFWMVEPPLPLKTRLYRCDKEFVLEPLRTMMEVSEIYGLIVMDRKEATLGMLEGKRIEVLQKMTSGVPSKIRAGGQCLSPDSLIMSSNGEIMEIKDSHNPLIIVSENFNQENSEETPIIAKWENEKELFRIVTKYPKIEIKASGEHTFFVRTENGIEEKALDDIKEGDYLVMPEKIDLNLEDQKIDFTPQIKQMFNIKEIKIPEKINSDFSRILGYYLGDGTYEIDRITFFEQREEVAKYYQNLIEKVFEIKSDLRFREEKSYWQIRAYSRILAQLFRQIYLEKDKTHNEKIPSIILRSSDKSLASFIAGFFDAEGYISKSRIAAGFNNEKLAKQIQLAFLRLGIIASINEYDNRKNPYSNNIRYTIAIDDLESIKKFYNLIGFISSEKNEKVRELIEKRGNRNKVRQLVVNGKEVARIIRNSGLNTRQFNCPDFFNNKKQLSKEVFKKRILDNIYEVDLRKRLEMFYNSNLITVKIGKIESLGIQKTFDIETKNHNFIANGLVVHNSSQRFHRITEGLTKEFYKRVAEEAKKCFFDNTRLKGIIVGGPIPTKDEFLDNDYLATQLRDKVIGRVDIGDVDESGLKELVEKSHELLAEQEVIYEKKLIQKFFQTLGEKPDLALYKEEDIRKALGYGAVDTLILTKDLPRNVAKELKDGAKNISAKIEIVSNETEEGKQFKNLGGVGALLRFG
ncbi:MAG: LAGLIDADG family homing endonuclease, partial [Nanoarchaeota archaeon]